MPTSWFLSLVNAYGFITYNRDFENKEKANNNDNDSMINFSAFPEYFTWYLVQSFQTFPGNESLQTVKLPVIWEMRNSVRNW